MNPKPISGGRVQKGQKSKIYSTEITWQTE